MHLTLSAS